jgi:hypothetical protein
MKQQDKKVSPRAQAVWGALDEKTRKIIQKDNPFRSERNKAIRELLARGVMYVVLEEITGMSDTAIQDIVNKAYGLNFTTQNRLLNELKKSFDILYESLSIILKATEKNVRHTKRKRDHR